MKPLTIYYSRTEPPVPVPAKVAVIRPAFLHPGGIKALSEEIDAGKIDKVIIAGPVFVHGWRIFTSRPVRRVVTATNNPLHALDQEQALQCIQQR